MTQLENGTMPEPTKTHNQIEYSVSEVAFALKRTVEETFGFVRVRGEISGWRGPHSSGHAYFRLKDEGAALDAVCWKGSLAKLGFRPEEGLEVVATGKLTTYPGKSNYQIVIERMEPAGQGALMALLEKRKQLFAAEGLFAPERKRPLPFLPRVIGVVTSPTGAVIRDILHRIEDRFPLHVIIWPVAVQGEGAAEQIAQAIAGFNALPASQNIVGSVSDPLEGDEGSKQSKGLFSDRISGGDWAKPILAPCLAKPDLLVIARGGGSIEDLWAFNEEAVVRAAADSRIPLISAVGHETDWTLIDLVADRRAPTPTAAAEMAVPVKAEWMLSLEETDTRLLAIITRYLTHHAERLQAMARGLPHPKSLIETVTQRLDDWSDRLSNALPQLVTQRRQGLEVLMASLRPGVLMQDIARSGERWQQAGERLTRAYHQQRFGCEKQLELMSRMLETVNVQRVLERGFALVKDSADKLITSVSQLKPGDAMKLQFADGEVKADIKH